MTPSSAAITKRGAILIVDDDAGNLHSLGCLLYPHYDVLAAPSGERALEIVNGKCKPDLILLDVIMPGLDGYDVLMRLRTQPDTVDIPVIFVTGLDASSEDEGRAFELGVEDFIHKPFFPSAVLARIRTQLELKHARDLLKERNSNLIAEVKRHMQDTSEVENISVKLLAAVFDALMEAKRSAASVSGPASARPDDVLPHGTVPDMVDAFLSHFVNLMDDNGHAPGSENADTEGRLSDDKEAGEGAGRDKP